MPGFDGTGPGGMGPMTGGGRGFCNTYGVGMAQSPYRTHRWASYTYPRYGYYGFQPFIPRMSREQGLDFLKNQAGALRDQLKELETEIEKFSAGK